MWKTRNFVYWCKMCKTHFLSKLFWNEAYCPKCNWGRKENEQPEFYVVDKYLEELESKKPKSG